MVNKNKKQIGLFPLAKAKDKIIKMIDAREDIKSLILGENSTEQNLDEHIFDVLYVNKVLDKVGTYVTLDTRLIDANLNTSLIEIIINVFSHLECVELSNNEKRQFYNQGYFGNRIDVLIDLISRMLCGNNEFGIGRLDYRSKNPIDIIRPSTEHYGKCIYLYMYDFKIGDNI